MFTLFVEQSKATETGGEGGVMPNPNKPLASRTIRGRRRRRRKGEEGELWGEQVHNSFSDICSFFFSRFDLPNVTFSFEPIWGGDSVRQRVGA